MLWAIRASLRALPTEFPTETESRERALGTVRRVLTAATYLERRGDELGAALDYVVHHVDGAPYSFNIAYGLQNISGIATNREILDAVEKALRALETRVDKPRQEAPSDANRAFNSALSYDVAEGAGFDQPLWPHGSRDLDVNVGALNDVARREPEWSFWARWYNGFLKGEPLDWALQEQIALIPHEEWEAGPGRIAERIAEIEADFLAAKMPSADRIVFDEADGLFRREAMPLERPDFIAAMLDAVSDALEDALARPSNGLGEDNRVTRTLRRTLGRYANDPVRIEMDLTRVYKSLTRQMTVSEDLPPSEENEGLREAALEGARAIRATHPDVAEMREMLNSRAIKEMSEEDIGAVLKALPALEEVSTPALGEEFREDAAALIADRYPSGIMPPLINDAVGPPAGKPPALGGVDAATRIFSRAAKMTSILHKMEGAADCLATRLGVSRGDVYSYFAALVSIGIGLIGFIA